MADVLKSAAMSPVESSNVPRFSEFTMHLLYVPSATIINVVSDHMPGEPSKVVTYGQIADWQYAVKL